MTLEQQGFEDAAHSQTLWRPLRRSDAIALVVTLVIAAAVVLPRVIWAPCTGDPGEVQLTAAVGGVGHPPGQAGIITIFRGLCFVLPFAPHLTVSGANAAFALAIVAILVLMQLRTGANPVAAGIASLLFLTDDQFWHAATLPETYATCILLLVASAWCFLSWLHHPRAWKFWLGVFLFAYLVVNRGPTIVYSVSFVAVALIDRRARRNWPIRSPGKVILLVIFVTLPLIIMLGSVWVRDVPGCGYNYLDQCYPSLPQFPPGNTTAADKAERLWWLVTARQYDYMFHPTLRTIRAQGNWLLIEFGARHWPLALPVIGVVLLGAATLWSRNRSAAIFVMLMIPSGIVSILLIRVVSHTTILPNIMFAVAWLFGIGLSRVQSWHGSAAWNAAVVTTIAFAVWWMADASFIRKKDDFDARAFVKRVNLASLPPDATLIAFDILPVIYEQQVRGVRPDVTVLLQHDRLSRAYLETISGPVFTTGKLPPGSGAELIGAGPVRRIRLIDP